MAIISVSLPDTLLDDLDRAITEGAYNGRSEFIRAAMRELLLRQHGPKTGHVHGAITLTYEHGQEARISGVRHAFHDVVLSLMHTHCEPEICMDVLTVGGDARRIRELQETLARMREVNRSHLALMV